MSIKLRVYSARYSVPVRNHWEKPMTTLELVPLLGYLTAYALAPAVLGSLALAAMLRCRRGARRPVPVRSQRLPERRRTE
jgi:hypothetical protein